MERWTWAFILQQVFMGQAWCFAVWAVWREVREIFAEKAALADGLEKEKNRAATGDDDPLPLIIAEAGGEQDA